MKFAFYPLLLFFYISSAPCIEYSFKKIDEFSVLNSLKIVDIEQDEEGFIWFVTGAKIFKYDGYKFSEINELVKHSEQISDIQGISIDQSNIWIFSTTSVWVYDKSTLKKPQWNSTIFNSFPNSIQDIILENGQVWIIGQNLVAHISENLESKIIVLPNVQNKYYFKGSVKLKHTLYIASKERLLSLDTRNYKLSSSLIKDLGDKEDIWSIHKSADDTLWLGTDSGVLFKTVESLEWHQFQPNKINYIIKSISSSEEEIWFATAMNGLISTRFDSDEVIYSTKNNSSLTNDELSKVFVDKTGLVWIVTFDNTLQISHSQFPKLKLDIACFQNEPYYGINEINQHIYLSAQSVAFRYIATKNQCESFIYKNHKSKNKAFMPKLFFSDSKNRIWMGGSRGFFEFNPQTNTLSKNYLQGVDFIVTAVAEMQSGDLILGTNKGFSQFNPETSLIKNISHKESESLVKVTAHINYGDKSFFSTSQGIVVYDRREQTFDMNHYAAIATKGDYITTLTLTNNQLFFAKKDQKINVIDLINNNIKRLTVFEYTDKKITNLINDDEGNLWISHNQGITVLRQNNIIGQFNEAHGVYSFSFIDNASHKDDKGMLYFGTRHGVIYINPYKLLATQPPQKVIITDLYGFNKKIRTNDEEGFDLSSEISLLDSINLSYKDYVFSLHFSALPFWDDSIEYQYKLEGFDPDWSLTTNGDNKAAYTNLPSGDYEFKVAIAGSKGIANQKILKIHVSSAPWLTGWAITLYFILFVLWMHWFIKKKQRASDRLMRLLKTEVGVKTQELSKQKETIEDLLNKKNEMFSHLSHEFRTPLTLILGPLNELLSKPNENNGIEALSMIQRNAQRMLTLIEQLLSLAKINDINKTDLIFINTHHQVNSIVESFTFLAKKHQIKITTVQNDEAVIQVSELFMDAVLGNLLSNAIKYSKPHSEVLVKAYVRNNQFLISVKDSGVGLTEAQEKLIFKKFERLTDHSHIDGIGIGLSVVKEFVDKNNGKLEIQSKLGLGCDFIVSVALAKELNNELPDTTKPTTLIKQLTEFDAIGEESYFKPASVEAGEGKVTILIIDDNKDMQRHLHQVLSPMFNCLHALNGKEGVELAIENIPDLIVCDVMMPEMDGYQVCRIIRHNPISSHIPLLMLTALSDKTSRIKGWQENIDSFMTKPFDKKELIVQINNILTIRSILKKKASRAIDKKAIHPSLTKQELKFVEKVKVVIEKNYHDSRFNRVAMAEALSISERQLQRKLKALIDQNPMDLLREFRLNKAAELLAEGQQITQTGDICGFNSPSYFSQCFRAQFGCSPKKYQQSIKNI